MRFLKVLLILFLFVRFVQLFANLNDTVSKRNDGSTTDREIGISITPVFTMDTVNPQITVISPNGAELWLMNTQKTILWSATDSNFITNPINIALSTDNGLNYSPVVDSIENTSNYLWIIPDLYGPQSLIKIWATDTFGNIGFDISDVVFTLPGTTVCVTPIFSMDTVDPIVELISPNGGEIWYVGENNPITWTAFDNNLSSLPISLEYKVDSSWLSIETAYGNDGFYQWLIPNVIAPEAYVKITLTDLFGNFAADSSASSFVINDATPAMVQNVSVSLIDSTQVRITWDPVTLTVQGNPIVPSGYIILANTSDEPMNMSLYYVLGATETETEYIDSNVLSSAPHMFYNVIAVKYNREKLTNALAEFQQINSKNIRIRWDILKHKLD